MLKTSSFYFHLRLLPRNPRPRTQLLLPISREVCRPFRISMSTFEHLTLPEHPILSNLPGLREGHCPPPRCSGPPHPPLQSPSLGHPVPTANPLVLRPVGPPHATHMASPRTSPGNMPKVLQGPPVASLPLTSPHNVHPPLSGQHSCSGQSHLPFSGQTLRQLPLWGGGQPESS